MSLTIIAIANAIVWSGVILFLLLRMMGERDQISEQIDRLEKQIDEPRKQP